jgi:hypothetical protein
MATTTPNFGWAVPTSTDLVKDGAVAIETLGDSIDASLVDLKGGTTGQVLAKASATDMDFSWVAQDDSNAIQNAIVDAKGDIIVATAADTPARLAVGTNGQVLKANSATATGLEWAADSAGMTNPMTTTGDTIYSSSGSTPARLGIGSTGQVLTVAGGVPSWATPAGGVTFSGCSAYNSSNLSIADTTWTTVTYNTERYDTDSYHDTSTNTSRFTIPTGKTGYFLISVTMAFSTNTTGSRNAKLIVNGSDIRQLSQQSSPSSFIDTFGAVLALTAADYVELQVLQTSGGSLNLSQGITTSWFDIAYLGA